MAGPAREGGAGHHDRACSTRGAADARTGRRPWVGEATATKSGDMEAWRRDHVSAVPPGGMARAHVEILLDSVILIDHLNGISPATEYLREVASRAAVSVISRAEVLAGYDEQDTSSAKQLLDFYTTLGIDSGIADAAASLRHHHRWKLPDAFQAAIAVSHGLRLATRNTRDFPPDRFPFVIVPYRLR